MSSFEDDDDLYQEDVIIPDPTCYHCSKTIKNEPYICKKCDLPYHPACANLAGVLPNGAIKVCCDLKHMFAKFFKDADTKINKLINTAINKNLTRIKKDVDMIVNTSIDKLMNEKVEDMITSKINEKTLQSTSNNQLINSESMMKNQCNIISEINLRNLKKKNLLFFNIKDSNDINSDNKIITTMLTNIELNSNNIKIFRIGTFSNNKTRPLKVIFNNKDDPLFIVRNVEKSLSFLPKNTKIKSDKTIFEMNYLKSIINELNHRINVNKEDNLTIKYKHGVPIIIKKSEDTTDNDTQEYNSKN